MSDATSVLFGLEDEFGVLDVARVDQDTVKVIIEQAAREGPCPACGVVTSAVKDRPLMRVKDLRLGKAGRAVVAKAATGLRRGVVWSEDIHPGLRGGATSGPGD